MHVGGLKQEWEQELLKLRQNTGMDFAGVAWMDRSELLAHWIVVSGNQNEQYRRIVLPISKGIIGPIVRSGRAQIFVAKNMKERLPYPIMLSERLIVAIGAPIWVDKRIKGILVVGARMVEFCDTQKVWILEKVQEWSRYFCMNEEGRR